MALLVLLVTVIGLTVGMKVADGWQTRHTDTMIGGGLAIGSICAIGLTVLPVVALIVAFMRRQATKEAPRTGEYFPHSPQAGPGLEAIRYQQALTRLERDRLALDQARQKSAINPPASLSMMEDDGIWRPVQGVWVDDTV